MVRKFACLDCRKMFYPTGDDRPTCCVPCQQIKASRVRPVKMAPRTAEAVIDSWMR